eukprot:gnl/TRDRNA2_/TRDRNA2_175586_c2_seq11.p1 gnl/TRDRNA2_/TRDRNA2_175586_c2~~gnl/TRDRNA2_/TRDRNA2_175586_c2_seq11.p1  ORF type:complete len:227 (+),score=41.94 gnl/TRDRNA2_/TRDRNA2_175586_c2_seq11:49-729(+)
MGRSEQDLFDALGLATRQSLAQFKAQELANLAWAFATARQPAPSMLDPILVLDAMEARGTKPQVVDYQMLMQCVAETGKVEAGHVLLERAEASGLLSRPADDNSDDNWYVIFRTLLETCRVVGDLTGASRVQGAVDRLGLTALAPEAVTLVRGSERRYENGVGGEGVTDARQLWLKLHQETAYKPQLQALPWAFVQSRTQAEQEGSLQLHAEKKALAVLLACDEVR